MKKFIISTIFVTLLFIGVGALVEKTGARFKSDDKALALIAKARQAIGGDAAITSIKSLNIVGKTTQSFKVNGALKSEDGETTIALQFPDKLMKSTSIGRGDGNVAFSRTLNQNVVVTGDNPGEAKFRVMAEGVGDDATRHFHVIIKNDGKTVKDLTGAEAEKWIAEHGEASHGEMKIIVKKPDGTVETVNGDGKPGDPTAGAVTVRKVEGGNATFTTSDGRTVVIRTDGNGDGIERHVIVQSGNGDNANFKTDDGHVILMKHADDAMAGKTIGGEHVMLNRMGGGAIRQNDLLRTSLSLLLTAPEGMDVSYVYGGEGDVDGTSCDIVVAEFAGSSYKLYLSKTSSLPVMMSYKGVPELQLFTFKKSADVASEAHQNMILTRKVEGGPVDGAETNVKFSDYRTVGGIQLPYKWTQTSGDASETFDITSYEVNPANIGEKFKNQNVMVRMKKPDGQK